MSLYKRLKRLVLVRRADSKLLRTVKHDCRSTTCANLRKIILMVNKHNVDEIHVDDLDRMQYNAIPDGDLWRVGMVKELNDAKPGIVVIAGFAHEEIT